MCGFGVDVVEFDDVLCIDMVLVDGWIDVVSFEDV